MNKKELKCPNYLGIMGLVERKIKRLNIILSYREISTLNIQRIKFETKIIILKKRTSLYQNVRMNDDES